MDALARTLHLSRAEHAYILRLTGHVAEPVNESSSVVLPPQVQRLLDAVAAPAFALTPHWRLLGWNRSYEVFYPGVANAADADRNLLWLVFTDPYVRDLLADWELDSRQFLTQFRSEAGSRVHDPAWAELVMRLQATSPEFRRDWASHDVDQFVSRERRFAHPIAGTLVLEQHRLTVSDCPDVHLVVYTAAPDSEAEQRLETLIGSGSCARSAG